jgi:hypothetical protein
VNEILYKFSSWWQHLGLVLLGIFFLKLFSPIAFFYLFLGGLLLCFAHSLDDRKKFSIILLAAIIFLISFLSWFQILLSFLIILLCFGYLYAKNYPISAFYKGFGYSLLFFLPFSNFQPTSLPFYFFISTIASISEIFHEANHFEQDKKEGRFTTAHLLNFKISNEGRKRWKVVLIAIGIILLIYFYLR